MDDAIFASLQAVVLSRAAERILLVLVGALSVYLGYSLFRHIPSVNKAEGRMELPGGVSIFLSRIGPGIFFALFGCAIIGYSVTRPVALTLPGDAVAAGEAIGYVGFGRSDGTVTPGEQIEVAGLEPEAAIARLNGFLAQARLTMSPPEAEELEAAVRAAKFALMLSAWKPQWGERAAFARWARENGDRDPPDDLVPGATIVYRTEL